MAKMLDRQQNGRQMAKSAVSHVAQLANRL